MTTRTKDHTSRPRWQRLSVVLATVTTVLLVGAGAGAATAPQQSQPGQVPGAPQTPAPPAVGSEIQIGISTNVLNINLTSAHTNTEVPTQGAAEQSLTIGPMEGGVTFRVEASDPLNPWSLRLKMTDFSLTTTDTAAPSTATDTEQQGPDLGKVTIEQSDTEVTPDSLVQMVSQFPPQWEQTMFLHFTMTIENPPAPLRAKAGIEQARKPLVLSTKRPAKWHGISHLMPRGLPYQLQNPIELVLADNPDQPIATIDKFPVQVGGL